MKKYLKYLWYVIKHKWYVGVECFKKGIYWRGLVHDNSKLLPDEFIPYARYFYGSKEGIKRGRNKTGYYKPTDTGDKAFDFAWLLHQKRNRHHWQWWIIPTDEEGIKIFEIPEPYLTEMVCDWIGAGKAQGHFSPNSDPLKETRNWWKANNKKMQLNENTRKYLINYLNKEKDIQQKNILKKMKGKDERKFMKKKKIEKDFWYIDLNGRVQHKSYMPILLDESGIFFGNKFNTCEKAIIARDNIKHYLNKEKEEV